MPIYEYQCPECANIFEEWAKASEMQDLAPCPLCKTPSERIISHTAFVLKGGGWYVTDYGYRKNISEDGAAGSAAAVPATAASPATGNAQADNASGDAQKADSSAAPNASHSPSAAPSGTPAATPPTSPASSAPSPAAPATGANSAA